MDIRYLFENKAKKLFWCSLDPQHLIGVPPPQNIDPGHAYFVIRLAEMYLGHARKLWLQIYPMLHCYTQAGKASVHSIVSPAQLRDLGDANLDRIVNLNVRLAGPTAYNGEEISILTGLYAIPSHDAIKALIDVVASFSSLDPSAIGRTLSLAGLIESGVESILGLDQATLQLGVQDSFSPDSHPLRSGYYLGVGASVQEVDVSQIWVVNGGLFKGTDAASAVPYSDHDYMLLAIDSIDKRDDWAQLICVRDSLKKFPDILGDTQFTICEKRSRLASLWPAFIQALADSPDLIDSDRDRIATIVAARLLKRLRAQDETNPFLAPAVLAPPDVR